MHSCAELLRTVQHLVTVCFTAAEMAPGAFAVLCFQTIEESTLRGIVAYAIHLSIQVFR